jgi:hypothetical protein
MAAGTVIVVGDTMAVNMTVERTAVEGTMTIATGLATASGHHAAAARTAGASLYAVKATAFAGLGLGVANMARKSGEEKTTVETPTADWLEAKRLLMWLSKLLITITKIVFGT